MTCAPLAESVPRPRRGQWMSPDRWDEGVDARREGKPVPPMTIQFARRFGWLEQDYLARHPEEWADVKPGDERTIA